MTLAAAYLRLPPLLCDRKELLMANNDNTLFMTEAFTEEEKEQIKSDFAINLKMAHSLTKEQINFLMDGGWYNDAMRGYIITAARYADFSDKEIKRLLNGFRIALNDKNKEEAEKVSKNF